MPAYGQSALLMGFQAGGALLRTNTNPTVAFRLGAGLDWLHARGISLQSRLELTHTIDTSFALLVGYMGEGLRAQTGLPLGLSAGPLIGHDLNGNTRVGARAVATVGLWYSRAVLELDVTMRRRLESRQGWELVLGLSLRGVPWAPFVL